MLNLEELFHFDHLDNTTWNRLTELKISIVNKCKTSLLTPVFELCRQLRKLELSLDGVCDLTEKFYENASNLVKLKISAEQIWTLNNFNCLENLRVLKLSSQNEESCIRSFEMISCLSNLVDLELSQINLSTQLEKFPAEMLNLRRLKLGFAHVQSITPTAFDHLVRLEQLEVTNDCLTRECKMCPDK
jgi:hypothetical protein